MRREMEGHRLPRLLIIVSFFRRVIIFPSSPHSFSETLIDVTLT